MGISDPVKNCLLEVCCGAKAAEKLFARQMVEQNICDMDVATRCAAWVYEYFDLAPAGSLTAFKAEIARLARDTRPAE